MTTAPHPQQPVSRDLARPDRAMVIAAHPDDAEFCAGATLAKWGSLGTAITHVVLTDGSKGTWDASVDQRELIAQRQTEQRAAAQVLTDTSHVEFLGYTDGDLAYMDTVESFALRKSLARLIRVHRPQVVFAHDPWKQYRLHPDHERAGWIAIQGIVAARDPFFHPELLNEGLQPHRPQALLLFEANAVTHVESVQIEAAHKKVDALLEHVSQLETTHFHRVQQEHGNDDAGLEDTKQAFRDRELRLLQATGGLYGVEFAEGFSLIDDQL